VMKHRPKMIIKVVPLPVNARVELNAPANVVEVGSACPCACSIVWVTGVDVIAVDAMIRAVCVGTARRDPFAVWVLDFFVVGDVVVVVVVAGVGEGATVVTVVVVVGCDTVVVVGPAQAAPRSTDP
jgi:hypothetical protein